MNVMAIPSHQHFNFFNLCGLQKWQDNKILVEKFTQIATKATITTLETVFNFVSSNSIFVFLTCSILFGKTYSLDSVDFVF